MSEETEPVSLNRGTVSFQRRLQRGDVSLMVSMQFDVDPSDMPGSLERARGAAFQVRGLVYEELGIDFKVDETGTLREVSAPEEPRTGGNQQTGSGSTPAGFKLPIGERPDHVKDWQWAKLVNSPGDWWDNRDPQTGFNPRNGPDFKHKTDEKSKIYLRPYQGQ